LLVPDERAALVGYCHDHAVAVCPGCSASLQASEIGTDLIFGHRDFCPGCRADLTPVLRKHLAGCTWIRVQGREGRDRAQNLRREARETSKRSQQLRDHADVLAREAEAVQQESRDVKRGVGTSGPGVNLEGVRILVVEDHDDSRELMEQSLRRLGATVTGVTSARDALAGVPDADIIVTDVGLRGESGIWLCEQVSRQPRPIPVIACSGYTDEQVAGMKHAGFSRTVLKPVDQDVLARIVLEVLQQRDG
jgi:CheY-like chemotaxis protein